jgi:hypothetical protein
MNAAARFVSWSAVPLGALLGGALGEAAGLRPTLVVCAVGSCLVAAWVALNLKAARKFRLSIPPVVPA